jgi:hypothetical protein
LLSHSIYLYCYSEAEEEIYLPDTIDVNQGAKAKGGCC